MAALEAVQADFDHVDGTDANRGIAAERPDRGYPSATADPLLSRSESSAFVSTWLVPNTCSCQTRASCSRQLPRYQE